MCQNLPRWFLGQSLITQNSLSPWRQSAHIGIAVCACWGHRDALSGFPVVQHICPAPRGTKQLFLSALAFKKELGAREMAQEVRGLTSLAEGSGVAPSTHIVQPHSTASSRVSRTSCDHCRYHTHNVHTCRQNT